MSRAMADPESREDTIERLLRQRFSRSAPIEEKLQMAGMGKRPLPTAEECLEWAAKLGVPDEARSILT